MDADGADETVYVISDVTLDAGGAPLWEDGHRWQVYVREGDGAITRLYARFLPNGKLTAEIVKAGSWEQEAQDYLALVERLIRR